MCKLGKDMSFMGIVKRLYSIWENGVSIDVCLTCLKSHVRTVSNIYWVKLQKIGVLWLKLDRTICLHIILIYDIYTYMYHMYIWLKTNLFKWPFSIEALRARLHCYSPWLLRSAFKRIYVRGPWIFCHFWSLGGMSTSCLCCGCNSNHQVYWVSKDNVDHKWEETAMAMPVGSSWPWKFRNFSQVLNPKPT